MHGDALEVCSIVYIKHYSNGNKVREYCRAKDVTRGISPCNF